MSVIDNEIMPKLEELEKEQEMDVLSTEIPEEIKSPNLSGTLAPKKYSNMKNYPYMDYYTGYKIDQVYDNLFKLRFSGDLVPFDEDKVPKSNLHERKLSSIEEQVIQQGKI